MSRVIDSVAFIFFLFVCLDVFCPLNCFNHIGFGLVGGILGFDALRTRGLLKYLNESKEGLFQEVFLMTIICLDFGFQQMEDSYDSKVLTC